MAFTLSHTVAHLDAIAPPRSAASPFFVAFWPFGFSALSSAHDATSPIAGEVVTFSSESQFFWAAAGFRASNAAQKSLVLKVNSRPTEPAIGASHSDSQSPVRATVLGGVGC